MKHSESSNFYLIPNFDDPRLGGVEARLEHQPLLKEKLARLFRTPLSAVESQIVVFRTEDVVPFLDSLTRGKLPTRRTSQGKSQFFKRGGEGWYYTTPNYSHTYFDRNPHYRRQRFQEHILPVGLIAQIQHHAYISVPRVNAFVHIVERHLRKEWWEHARLFLRTSHFDEDRAHIHSITNTPESVRENFCAVLFEDLEAVLLLHREDALGYIADLPIMRALQEWLESSSQLLRNLLVTHLAITAISRWGIQIGFNEKLLEGRKIATDARPVDGVIHEEFEMAVYAPHGVTAPLNSIAYIQPMGTYEKDLLSKLGILSPSSDTQNRE